MSNTPTRLEITQVGPCAYALAGEIDAHAVPALAETFRTLPDGPDDIDIDLKSVTFIDSSGLRVLIDVHQRAEDASRRMVLQSPSQSVARLLEVAGLAGHFHVSPDPAPR
jgi:anti-sigma B factor antagonist